MSRGELGRIAAVIAVMATLASCSDSTAPQRSTSLAASSPSFDQSPPTAILHPTHACTSSTDVHDVHVTPVNGHVAVGGTIQLHATAHDMHGRTIHGATFCFSIDGHDASVSETGLVTGLHHGGPLTVHVTTSFHDHTVAGHAVVTVTHSTSHVSDP